MSVTKIKGLARLPGLIQGRIDSMRIGGVKANGTADDTAALQRAIDYQYDRGGGVVLLPRGTIRITDTISLRRGVALDAIQPTSIYSEIGNAKQPTTIKWDGALGGTMFGGGNLWQGRIENIYFDGNFGAAQILALGGPQNSVLKNLVLAKTAAGIAGTAISFDMTGQLGEAGGPFSGQQFPSSGFNKLDTVIVRDVQYGALYMNGVVVAGVVTAAVTLNTFVNCRFNGGAGAPAVVINQACDTNNFFGGDINAGAGQTGLVLNFSTTNGDVYSNNFYGTSFENSDASGTGIDARNNNGFNYFYGCHIPTQGTQYAIGDGSTPGTTTGKIVFDGGDILFRTPAGPTPGASPWTYLNTLPFKVEFMFWGGTVSAVDFIRNGTPYGLGLTSGTFVLEPGDGIKITHTGAPTVVVMPH